MTAEHSSMTAPPVARLLLVDDDQELAELLAEYLRRDGFEMTHAGDIDTASRSLTDSLPDLVILDVMLSGRSGFDGLREWRSRWPRLPVVMLTARGEPVDRVLGLELGADDYLAKPFDPRELVARIRAVLRRSLPYENESDGSRRLGALSIDARRRRVTLADRPLDLTGAEYRVLVCLASASGIAMDRSALTEQALGRPLTLHDRSIDTHVSNLRRKIERAGSHGITIRAVRGTGYELLDISEASI